jgi:hypothetical protein
MTQSAASSKKLLLMASVRDKRSNQILCKYWNNLQHGPASYQLPAEGVSCMSGYTKPNNPLLVRATRELYVDGIDIVQWLVLALASCYLVLMYKATSCHFST